MSCPCCKPIELMSISEAQERGRRAVAQLQATDLPDHVRDGLQAIVKACSAQVRRLIRSH